MLSSKGKAFENAMNVTINRAKRKITQDNKLEQINRVTSTLTSGNDSAPVEAVEAHRAATYGAIKDIQDMFSGSLIRRTTLSKRFDGKALNEELMPCVEHVIAITLPPTEKAIMDNHVRHLAQSAKNKGGRVFENHVCRP